ncbi:MAG: 3-deoxy-manno-octulosonate cytidylyltransferase [Calditrichaeota bacterium]|nr:3-deoxy-manno-octulosonate cytidylyltransferase [Calditrichota bacterium]
MNVICVIPARYGSTRFPGKPLTLIGQKPMIRWVYERAVTAAKIDRVLVATDDERIASAVRSFGGEAVLTPSELPSGTDRVAAAVKDENADVVINLQGDEPFVKADLLDALVQVFEDHPEVQIATPIKRIESDHDLFDPNLVRVVKDKNGWALFFTRATIPYLRDIEDRAKWLNNFPFFKHVGIYAYRKDFLMKMTHWSQSSLEKAEKLEQLRVLENGGKIFTIETDYESVSVDTPEDLKKVNKIIEKEE